MEITEVVTGPRSPWQNPYAERLIGSIRRECLDHVIIFNERHLRRVLSSYFQYHHDTRTHLALGKDCPRRRHVQPPSTGNIIAFPEEAVCTIAMSVEPPEGKTACSCSHPSNCHHVNFEQGQPEVEGVCYIHSSTTVSTPRKTGASLLNDKCVREPRCNTLGTP